FPADSGTISLMRWCNALKLSVLPSRLYVVNCVSMAIMPQPMSTPTAAGMIAPSVGMTDPTVAPRPGCASDISARCGNMNGIVDVASACSRALSSSIDAQLTSFLFMISIPHIQFTKLMVQAREHPDHQRG